MSEFQPAPINYLFLSQGVNIETHPGWQDALERLQKEGLVNHFDNIPYLGYAAKYGWDAFFQKVIDLCKTTAYDIVYFQYFHKKGSPSPRKCINAIRELLPNVVIITSSGDPISDNWMPPGYHIDFIDASRGADLTFSTQMGKAADKMIRWGARNVVLSPNSMCQKRFHASKIDPDNHHFDFDVVFVGSRNIGRNPLNRNFYNAKKRYRLVRALYENFGERFGLFGNNWDGYLPNHGPVKFDEQQKTFQRGRIVVGGNPYSHSDYYSSNRLFFEISSGIPAVELSVPRLDKIVKDQEQVYFCDDIPSLIDCCKKLLQMPPKILYEKAAKAAQEIADRHTQYHRMKFQIEYALAYRANGRILPDTRLPFLLPEVDWETERKYALRSSNK